MAEGSETEDVKNVGRPGGSLPVMPLVLAILVAVVVSVGGLGAAGVWLVRSGRMPLGGPSKVEAASKPEPVNAKLLALDPLLVNLADEGGHAYLRVGIVLRVEESAKQGKPKEGDEEKPEKGKTVVSENDVLLRDAALSVVGHETAETLLARDGKDRLKAELRAAMQDRITPVKLQDVWFTEFLVQR